MQNYPSIAMVLDATIILILISLVYSFYKVFDKLGDLTLTINKMDNKLLNVEDKFGVEIELYVDGILLELIKRTPFTDLKLYLTKKRDVMLAEVMHILRIGVKNCTFVILNNTLENIRRKLKNYAQNVSPEFKLYDEHSTPLRETELDEFKMKLADIIQYGNGSRGAFFVDVVKKYIEQQLEYTFTDYQEFRANGYLKRKEELQKSTKEMLHELVRENNLDLVFFEFQKILKTLNNNELENRLTILMSQHSAYLREEQLAVSATNINELHRNLIRNIVNFIDTVLV